MKTANVGFRVIAQTGALRRSIERVEKAALELEQAIADLNEARIEFEIEDLSFGANRREASQGRPPARSGAGAERRPSSEDEGADAPSQIKQ